MDRVDEEDLAAAIGIAVINLMRECGCSMDEGGIWALDPSDLREAVAEAFLSHAEARE